MNQLLEPMPINLSTHSVKMQVLSRGYGREIDVAENRDSSVVT